MNIDSESTRVVADLDDADHNPSSNWHLDTVLAMRLSRRAVLRGGVAGMTVPLLGVSSLSGCGGDSSTSVSVPAVATNNAAPEVLLGFQAVAKSLADKVTVPAGYSVSVLYALGDPIFAGVAPYKNDGSDTDFDKRAGDHHDGMEFFGLSATGSASNTSSSRGLLVMNHEATTDERLASFFLHANGGTTTLPRPASEVDKELAIHGISIVEIVQSASGKWSYVQDSGFNRRLTPLTEIALAGPARASALMVTAFSPDGTKARGTINNCGTGTTPWGTFVSGEENWANYYTRQSTDDAARGNDKSVTALKRYGRNQGATSRHGWESAGTDGVYARWNNSKLGTSVDGSDDYRHDMNTMGFIVELDPYNKTLHAKKRTALGRFAHESAAFGQVKAGQPVAVYMGDDSRNEYIYKWVSSANWETADANPADRMATGDKYLDSGTLYVAKFNADGTGQWLALSLNQAAISSYTGYAFTDAADIAVNTRLAADAVGATKMDRPEWCAVNPANGEIYYSLTNNSNRRVEPTGSSQLAPDSANPRAYTDMKGSTSQQGNPNGHILRIREDNNHSAATGFSWDIYLVGAESGADKSKVNLSSLTDDQDFSSPDGLAFTRSTGIGWFQTDDGAYTDVTNCMMLAGLPGSVGDGQKITLSYPTTSGGSLNIDTYIGKSPAADKLKRFLVGPVGCEITGLCETPDGKTLFINIQHPGETTSQANLADPSKYTSQWPANAGYGAGSRPRSATIVITKDNGGRVGT